MPSASPWKLERFLVELDSWADREAPDDDLRLVVTAWIMTRFDDPYRGVRREPGFGNLWFGPVPDSDDGKGNVVACSYWVVEFEGVVRCNGFATLGLPM